MAGLYSKSAGGMCECPLISDLRMKILDNDLLQVVNSLWRLAVGCWLNHVDFNFSFFIIHFTFRPQADSFNFPKKSILSTLFSIFYFLVQQLNPSG